MKLKSRILAYMLKSTILGSYAIAFGLAITAVLAFMTSGLQWHVWMLLTATFIFYYLGYLTGRVGDYFFPEDDLTLPPLCPNCGYDIRLLPEKRCPECGETWESQ